MLMQMIIGTNLQWYEMDKTLQDVICLEIKQIV